MRARSSNPRKVNVVTLGCAKNMYDSEQLMTQLKANDFEVEHEASKDDFGIVVINTCGFIESAKQESIDMILRFADAKKKVQLKKYMLRDVSLNDMQTSWQMGSLRLTLGLAPVTFRVF